MKLSYKNTRHPRVHVGKDTGFAEGVERTGVTQPASLILGLLLRVAYCGKPVSHSIMAMTNVADG